VRYFFIIFYLFIFNGAHCQNDVFNKVYDDDLNYNGCISILFDSTTSSYILCGVATDFNVYHSISITKINHSGDTIWQRNFFDIVPEGKLPNSSCLTSNGNYIFCGTIKDSLGIGADDLIFELDTSGNLLWWKRYGGSGNQTAQMIKRAYGGGYVVCGWSTPDTNNFRNGHLFRVDELGNLLWENIYGDVNDETFYSIDIAPDGGYILGGITDTVHVGDYDLWLLKVDTSGNFQWQKKYGTSNVEWGHTVITTSDLCYLICGRIESNGNTDAYLLKADTIGNVLWSRTFGNLNDFELYYDVAESNQIIIATGSSDINYHEGLCSFYKLNGDFIHTFYLRHDTVIDPNIQHYLYDVYPINSNLFALCGERINNNLSSKNDAWLVLMDSSGCDNSICGITSIPETKELRRSFIIRPNPASLKTIVDFGQELLNANLSIYDLYGKLLFNCSISSQQLELDLSPYNKGVYLLSVSNNKFISFQKLIIN